ncbi:MAG: ferredoxin--NADP reductase [SAR202 cluster bacterium]|nr:ferredoxin--NADP reductase [SAR202 cluster bacterium]
MVQQNMPTSGGIPSRAQTAARAPVAAARRPLPTAEIVKRVDYTHDLWSLWLKPELPHTFTFKAGQYCTIGREGIERAYSIVSAPHESLIELFIELVPEGELTPKLHKSKVGEKVTFRPSAKGVFTFNPKFTRHLMVATVTGVVPFVSIVRDALHKGLKGFEQHKFHILEGASYHDEFAYDKELEAVSREFPGTFTFIPTVSRPNDPKNSGWPGEKGRVNTLVEKYVEEFKLEPASTLVYACGHPGMIEDVKERLAPRGFTVTEERFWKQ